MQLEQHHLDNMTNKIIDREYYIRELLETKQKSLRNGSNSAGDFYTYRVGAQEEQILTNIKENPYFGRS